MPDNQSVLGINSPIQAAAAGAVAGATVTQLGVFIYEKLTGNAYSEKDRKKLAELKRLYEKAIQLSAPVSWDLDDKFQPTHQVKSQRWSLYIEQLRQSKRLVGHYHYQSSLIAEYASTYLTERGKRWIGSGKLGDLIEQFLGDWIHFALNDLPTLGVDDESVKKIERRIQYIEQVQKHEAIFEFGFVTRTKNKLDTIESIKQQLKSCLDLAAQESVRQCAREKFDHCRADLAALLFHCVQTMYYARKTDACHEPLELLRFIEPEDKFLTGSARKLYPIIKATHTGKMLYEVIALAGLESFGTLGQKIRSVAGLTYFDKDNQIKVVNWKKCDSDLPDWVPSDAVDKQLTEFQLIGESLLRVAKLKRLIEDAYDLTGKVGDLWAYGDKQGKLSLKAVLFLLEKEIDLLKKRLDLFFNYHNAERQSYNLKKRINSKEGSNPNFNKVDDQKVNIDKLLTSIKNSSQSIQEQMTNIPENLPKRIDSKKQAFYQSVSTYLKQFYPEAYSQYRLLEHRTPSASHHQEQTNSVDIDLDEGVHKMNNVEQKLTLIWPLKSHQQYPSYRYLDKAEFKPFLPENPKEYQTNDWKLGQKYHHWVKAYFVRHQLTFDAFQKEMKVLQEQATNPTSIEEITKLVERIQNQITQLRRKIEDERPAWRFKLGLWPIKT